MTDPTTIAWPVALWLLAALLLIGCATRPHTPAPAPAPAPELDVELSLLVERAVLATATARCAECPACREDFQSTFDILDAMLDEPETEPLRLADLIAALSWMKVDKLPGPGGAMILTGDSVLIFSGSGPIRPIEPAEVDTVARAVWVGLNKWKGTPSDL